MKVASVQADVVFNAPDQNADWAIEELNRLAPQGVELAVFPECFLTGYCVDDAVSARAIAIPIEHPALLRLQGTVDALGIHVVVGFAERTEDAVYNAAALLTPNAPWRRYRKTHLPDLGLDKFVRAGDCLQIFDTTLGKIGILICFDLRPPEATRALTLQGADLVVLPTNWPVGAEITADHICIARAAENKVFIVTCDRVGEENGFRFIGRSKIISPVGHVLVAAEDIAKTLVAELDLRHARQKRNVMIPGKYETEILASRRPDLYGDLLGENAHNT